MVNFKAATIILGITLCCQFIIKFVLFLDVNKRIYNQAPGTCSNVARIGHGAEDIELIDNDLIIVSTGLKTFPSSSNQNDVVGRIYLYNVTAKTAWELKLNSKTLNTRNFFPHGISVYKEFGECYLFIINHRPKFDSVEIFKLTVQNKLLDHLKTIRSPFFINLDNVVALSKDSFYVINNQYFKRSILRAFEFYLWLPLGNIVYYDGQLARCAANWIMTPSGIAMDISKKWLYVSSFSKDSIYIYRIYANKSLNYHGAIELLTAPDNIVIDPYTAELYVATHPVKLRKLRYEISPETSYSPSQILRIRGRPGKGNWTVNQLYTNDGGTLSSASVAIRVRDKLIIGSTHDKLIVCDIDSPHLY